MLLYFFTLQLLGYRIFRWLFNFTISWLFNFTKFWRYKVTYYNCPRILRLNSRTCSRTYCGCLRTSLRTFYDFLRTSLRTKHIFLRTIIASIYECDFREENHMVVGHFKRYFKYTLYIIISMNIVMSTSKD